LFLFLQIYVFGDCCGNGNFDICGICDGDGTLCAQPSWRLQLAVELDSYDQFHFQGSTDWLLTDDQNFIGAAEDATWDYDIFHDAPEPPNGPGNFIKLFFDHDEWDSWVTHYTEDIVADDTSFFSTNLTRWDGRIESNVPGTAWLRISTDMGDVPDNYQMYILFDNALKVNGVPTTNSYHRIEDLPTSSGEYTEIEFYLEGAGQEEFSIFIGNIPPQAPDGLTATGHYESISLDWDADGSNLDDIGNRYVATSYNVYRDDQPSDPNSNCITGEAGENECTNGNGILPDMYHSHMLARLIKVHHNHQDHSYH
jgi:hypothetical protein